MNRYRVRVSVTEMKPFRGPMGVMGAQAPDKLLDASFTTDDVTSIRSTVHGLLIEGMPYPDERLAEATTYPDPLDALAAQNPGVPVVMSGGKHSGKCTCSGCVEPEAEVPPVYSPPIGTDSEQA